MQQKLLTKNYVLTILTLLIVAQLSFGQGDITFTDMEKYLQAYGIKGPYSSSNHSKLITLYQYLQQKSLDHNILDEPHEVYRKQKIAQCIRILTKKKCELMFLHKTLTPLNKKDKNIINKALSYGLKNLIKKRYHQCERQRSYAVMLAKNILYSILANHYENRKFTFQETMQLLFKKTKTRLNIVPKNKLHEPITLQQADKEAKYLVNPHAKDQKRFLSVNDLSGLTHLELANLDVKSNHHLWYSNKSHAKHKNPWARLERQIAQQVTKQLRKNNKLLNSESYSFNTSRRVVTFKKVTDQTGSHPKIRVIDQYGYGWKLKWGDEFYSEAVANRLYIALGGKYQDLNYTHLSTEPILLIFPNLQKKEETTNIKNPCINIQNFNQLYMCLDKNLVKSNFGNPVWAIDQGTITLDNSHHLAARVNSKLDLTKHLGSSWALISEVSMEFRDKKILKRLGPMAQSTLGSEDDRAMRGMILLHLWLDNFDAKDSNGESVIIKNKKGKDIYVQSPTDLGGAFRGSPIQGVGINHFKHKNFMRFSSLSNQYITYSRFLLYRPKTAKTATFADLLWMAKKIVALPLAAIQSFVAVSQLPDFLQQTLVFKLVERQKTIAHLFAIDDLLDQSNKDLTPPTVHINLASALQRKKTATKYHIPLVELNSLLTTANVKANYIDAIVTTGKVSTCKKSVIINLLEKYVIRSGITRNPLRNKEHYQFCRFRR